VPRRKRGTLVASVAAVVVVVGIAAAVLLTRPSSGDSANSAGAVGIADGAPGANGAPASAAVDLTDPPSQTASSTGPATGPSTTATPAGGASASTGSAVPSGTSAAGAPGAPSAPAGHTSSAGAPATSAAPPGTPNKYTPTQVCGSGFTVIDHHALSGATIYLLYNASTGYNCVTTMATSVRGEVAMNATLTVQNGSSASDPGNWTYYAGPVTEHAPSSCVEWGGTYKGSSWTSGWSHCG
jgi:hypothetical protein